MTEPNERFLDWSTSTVRVTPRPATEPEPLDEPNGTGLKYSDDQPRDESGRWTDTGGGGGGAGDQPNAGSPIPGRRIDAIAPTGDEIHGIYARGVLRNPHAELVPIGEIERLREFYRADRRAGLDQSIAVEGIKEPLIVQYSKTERTALLIEGNHRLDEARRAGHTHVPVVVHRRESPFPVRPASDGAMRPRPVPGYTEGRVPEEMRPSQIGIPRAFRPPNAKDGTDE